MSTTALLQALVVAVVAIVIGGLALMAVRRLLTPRMPLIAALLGVVVTIAIIGVAASSVGFDVVGTPIWLILGAFLGFVGVQRHPRETRSFLRGLALAAGCASLYAAWEANLMAVIFGIGVTGLLLKVSTSNGSASEVNERAV
jgi:hypothetical protein